MGWPRLGFLALRGAGNASWQVDGQFIGDCDLAWVGDLMLLLEVGDGGGVVGVGVISGQG